MKVTVDTNVLLRAVARDDREQGEVAARLLANAGMVAVTLPCLCEFVWVLRGVYRFAIPDAAAAVRALMAAPNVEMDRSSVKAGLAMMDAGGDFADGVIAHEGRWLGGRRLFRLIGRRWNSLRSRGRRRGCCRDYSQGISRLS